MVLAVNAQRAKRMRLQLKELGVVVEVLKDGIDSVKIIFDGFTLVRHRNFLDLN